MLYPHLVALALAATTLVAAGCGSSSKSESTTTAASAPVTATAATGATATTTGTTSRIPPAAAVTVASGKPLTRAQWIAKGNVICAHLHKELETLNVTKISELPRVLPQAAAYERTAATELAKLVPPTSKANDWKQFLSATMEWSEGSSKVAEEAKLGDAITRSPTSLATVAVQKHLMAIAGRDGLVACARV